MKYEIAKILREEEFKRAVGVSKKMFDKMVKIIKENLRTFGRPPALSREDQLLMTLMYLREYRTEFHIGLNVWGK
ncbi:transposase family protein [Candidatus Halobeggiatoa sp. HSG11]|nr:transposase family protein [Candidatus Halobeggiatoa sp. HSG11]